ncbi:nucleoside triphosphate pyrophosphohydrolase [soil metagenome]
MPPASSLDATLALMRDLRKRCDWDAAQTHDSLRPYLVEESLELDEALRLGDDALVREELGDLLLQVLFHSVVAEERGAFTFHDVAAGLIAKMKARHPHLYGDGERESWERMKSKKRASIADGLPASLPPLHRAHRLQDRAAGVGFDWPDAEGPADKVAEELAEVRELMQEKKVQFSEHGAPLHDDAHAELQGELGDLLFACVNLCRKLGVHSSLALDKANAKFQRRFEHVEKAAAERGLDIGSAGLDALDAIWDEVKKERR